MMYPAGPMHTLHPKYWKEWCAENKYTLDLWVDLMSSQPDDCVYDLEPDDLRQTFDAIYRSAGRRAFKKSVSDTRIISSDLDMEAIKRSLLKKFGSESFGTER